MTSSTTAGYRRISHLPIWNGGGTHVTIIVDRGTALFRNTRGAASFRIREIGRQYSRVGRLARRRNPTGGRVGCRSGIRSQAGQRSRTGIGGVARRRVRIPTGGRVGSPTRIGRGSHYFLAIHLLRKNISKARVRTKQSGQSEEGYKQINSPLSSRGIRHRHRSLSQQYSTSYST